MKKHLAATAIILILLTAASAGRQKKDGLYKTGRSLRNTETVISILPESKTEKPDFDDTLEITSKDFSTGKPEVTEEKDTSAPPSAKKSIPSGTVTESEYSSNLPPADKTADKTEYTASSSTVSAAYDNPEKETKKSYVSASSHIHEWKEITETIHHDAEYKTVHHNAVTEEVKITDSQAWTEYIYKDICVCNECGYSAESYEELDSHFWDAHDYEYSGWHSESVLEQTIEHPEEFHYETRTISEAYDEQVVTKQAYDETITTGYKCATCGERK